MAITTTKQNASSIAMALAGKSHRVDIPRPRDSASAATGLGRSGPAPQLQGVDLPTPPASISPSLPPQAYQQHKQAILGAASPPSPPLGHGVESDFDLQDAVDHARAQDTISHPKRREQAADAVAQSAPVKGLDASSLAALESCNAVNPSMLAREHLPNILLENGPLAIRYIMGFLTQTVPGFSTIPGAKARRLVVAALEGGFNQEVEFEKVGWGRWDAHKRGERRASRQSSPGRELSGLPRYSSSSRDRSQLSSSRERSLERTYNSYPSQPTSSLRIPNRPTQPGNRNKRRPSAQMGKSTSPDLAPVPFGMEMDADRMSLDGEDDERSGGGSSTTNPDDVAYDEDMDEQTDEEDWASMGAAALRAGSYSHSHGTNRMLNSYSNSHGAKHHTMTLSHRTRRDSATHAGVHKRTGGMRTSSLAKSAPSPNLLAVTNGLKKVKEDALEGCADDNEREAVAALLSLGAM